MITAQIVADSKNKFGNRLTTFVLQFPRIVLAEFNTHRMISRNSASSRAIPFAKMLDRVQTNPFIPIAWMKDHSGMQGNEFFEVGSFEESSIKTHWMAARDVAVKQAIALSDMGLTKQVVNRLLEPFMWHTVICTGTEWENFFALRAHPAAEIHIAKLAELMLEEYNKSTPKELKDGEWHIPFGDKFDGQRLYNTAIDLGLDGNDSKVMENLRIKIATARCARVSYLNFEGKDDFEADIKLHDNLSKMGHMSPFEHCAKVMDNYEYDKYISGNTDALIEYNDGHGNLTLKANFDETNTNGWCGNFRGFIQYRKMIKGENKTDDRVIKVKMNPSLLN